jgi:hypothetical protein
MEFLPLRFSGGRYRKQVFTSHPNHEETQNGVIVRSIPEMRAGPLLAFLKSGSGCNLAEAVIIKWRGMKYLVRVRVSNPIQRGGS